ncbi:hypothetical protein [Rhizobium leguminosarum]|uniref:hypothetical protein n=1 Tax=Rhizobium leguminosarum TaxID=384 RepID=UPI00160CE575|nr:hypothetical protein [Rhizobium leguminosarum]MBB4433474.1 hypothetical protein [Rhizobium esperanzae]MBB4294397.1 hypothetical protein [Rhizobium leguminosarum]MBB4526950.1 hypothetical protein [Rhizobium leguminosarum]MBB4542975.1 hypothetical protein [Rhizobium leguminosarum]MBB5650728.1 hypothetical protein [Rhizobium leguminosarum]
MGDHPAFFEADNRPRRDTGEVGQLALAYAEHGAGRPGHMGLQKYHKDDEPAARMKVKSTIFLTK